MNREEKQKLVLELNKQGKTIREIAQIAHMSFGDICFIIRRETGEAEEQERSRISKASQALKLFEQGNNPVQVAIKLDIQTQEVERLYKEYWKLNGLYKLNEIYTELKENMFSFVKLYRLTKKDGITPQQLVNLLKIAEEIPYLEAERRRIEDVIEEDGAKILELNERKASSANEFSSILEEVESAREYKNNQLKSIQEELELAHNELKLEQEKLDRQKASLATEINKCKECLVGVDDAKNQLISFQEHVDKLKQEEQQLTSRIERLNSEEQQEQYVQRGQSQPQLVYQQPIPNLSEEELRRLAIPLICNNWESKWGELMHHGLHDRAPMSR